MKIKLYWDMDGVLADWDERCHYYLGNNPEFLRLDAKECLAIDELLEHHEQDKKLFDGMPWIGLVDRLEYPMHLCDFMDTYCAPSKYNLAYREARQRFRSFKEACLPHYFFKELRPYEDAIELLSFGQTIDPVPTILTAPMGKDANDLELRCRQQKFQWMSHHFADQFAFNFICTEDKNAYAFKEEGVVKVLIDDRFKNLKHWMNDGGIPVLHKETSATKDQLYEIYLKYKDNVR